MATTWLASAPAGIALTFSYYASRLPGVQTFLNAPDIIHQGVYVAHQTALSNDRSRDAISQRIGQSSLEFGAGCMLNAASASVGLQNIAGPLAKGVRCLAASVRWLDQWTRVQAAARRVMCILNHVPTVDEMRTAALDQSPIVVCEKDCLNNILPALSRLLAELAGAAYYADRAARAASDSGDATLAVIDAMDTARIFQTNTALAAQVKSLGQRALRLAGLQIQFDTVQKSLERSGAVMQALAATQEKAASNTVTT